MTAEKHGEFAKRVMLLAGAAEDFRPTATYDADGDCIEFLFKPDPFFAERIDDLVTVYYSQDTGEVIGSLIKGVSGFCRRILERMPGFQIVVQDGRVRLEHLFLASLWSRNAPATDIVIRAYRKLIEAADRANIDVETELCHA